MTEEHRLSCTSLWPLQSHPVTVDSDERRLVERVIAAQPGADKEFIDRYGPVVVRVLRRFQRISQEDREDCWQEVLWKFFENACARLKAWLRAWRGGSRLSGYIAVTARRIAIDLVRSRTFVKDGKTFKREVPAFVRWRTDDRLHVRGPCC
jgi:DNA-directed RNA polymerase specialized sigma24 family protein